MGREPTNVEVSDRMGITVKVVEKIQAFPLEPESLELILRFGIDNDGKGQTLAEVAKRFKVTRERIRQIEVRALKKLRQPSISSRLKDFVE